MGRRGQGEGDAKGDAFSALSWHREPTGEGGLTLGLTSPLPSAYNHLRRSCVACDRLLRCSSLLLKLLGETKENWRIFGTFFFSFEEGGGWGGLAQLGLARWHSRVQLAIAGRVATGLASWQSIAKAGKIRPSFLLPMKPL